MSAGTLERIVPVHAREPGCEPPWAHGPGDFPRPLVGRAILVESPTVRWRDGDLSPPTCLDRPRMLPSFHARFVLALGALVLSILFGACSSTGSSKPPKSGIPLRVRYLAYASGQKLELVNESHTDKIEMYSSTKKLDEAGTKVTTDEVLDETIANFAQNGFFERAVPGSAPLTPPAGISQALEVEKDGRTTFWAIPRVSGDDDRKRFRQCTELFTYVYNSTFGMQSVERAPDWESQNAAMRKKQTP